MENELAQMKIELERLKSKYEHAQAAANCVPSITQEMGEDKALIQQLGLEISRLQQELKRNEVVRDPNYHKVLEFSIEEYMVCVQGRPDTDRLLEELSQWEAEMAAVTKVLAEKDTVIAKAKDDLAQALAR